MARGRMVNTTIATDRRLASLSLTAEYLYLKTIPHLDRDGLILGDSSLLWAKVAPRRPELLSGTDDIIAEWLALDGLVIAYDTADGRALFFPGFAKNQIGMRYDREPESTIGCPPGYARTPAGLIPDDSMQPSGNLPADIRQPSGSYPAEVKGREVKREIKGNESAPLAHDDDIPPEMRAINNAYDACGLMVSKTHMDAHLETIKRTGLTNWQRGWAAAADKGKQNVPSYVARCAESAMLDEQKSRSNGNGRNASGSGFGLQSLTTDADRAYHAANNPEAIAKLQAEWDAS